MSNNDLIHCPNIGGAKVLMRGIAFWSNNYIIFYLIFLTIKLNQKKIESGMCSCIFLNEVIYNVKLPLKKPHISFKKGENNEKGFSYTASVCTYGL